VEDLENFEFDFINIANDEIKDREDFAEQEEIA
jgi:hypothetical protein